MSTWMFDLGNSRLKCAPLCEGRVGEGAVGEGAVGKVLDVHHDGNDFDSGWVERLPPQIDTAFVASVATPALTVALLDALTQRCVRISLARTQRACTGVRIAYGDPRQLGVDRFLALLGAHARARAPWLVVGVGTALTIDLLDADGIHRGGRIAPSPTLMREALNARAPHLPSSGGTYAEFADDTAAALASGCEGAALALIARSVDAATTQLGIEPRVLLHGGGARVLWPRVDAAAFAPTLVLEGLARWASTLAVA
jgi:type III pantothenate kinase